MRWFHSEVKILFVISHSSAFFFSLLLRGALTVALFWCPWQKQSVWGHCESWSNTSKHCSPCNHDTERVTEMLLLLLSLVLSVVWKVSWCRESLWKITEHFYMELRLQTVKHGCQVLWFFWRTGSAWQQLIYGCQTYLAMTNTKQQKTKKMPLSKPQIT